MLTRPLFSDPQNGLASSLPYLGKYLMALGTGVIADYLKSRNKISTTAIRKTFTVFGKGGSAVRRNASRS